MIGKRHLSIILFIFTSFFLHAQRGKIIFSGQILDKDNLEPVSFAPVQFVNSFIGQIADQDGKFRFGISDSTKSDTLKITYVGYEPYFLVFNKEDIHQTENLRILLEKAVMKKEIFIKSKYSRSYLLWRKVVRKKEINNYNKLDQYAYNIHNRLEINFNNINVNKLEKNKLLKKFNFILKNADSTEFGQVALPFFITETISDIYYQKKPYYKREFIHGILSSGIKNESILSLLGGSYQNINFYENQIPLFNKELISPFATNADLFYNFKILDTQYIQGQRLIHFLFVPKTFADNTFDGDCWIRDSIFAIQKINLRLNKDANINFIKRANFMQEFQLLNDSLYFLKKVNFVAEVAPTDNSNIEFLIRKIATYKNINLDTTYIHPQIRKNVAQEEIVLADSAKEKDKLYWESTRHEKLTKSEMLAHSTIDTLWKMPLFIKIIDGIKLLESGFLDIGKFQIGKWWSILGRNPYNKERIRLELSNNEKLSRNFNFQFNLTLNSKQQLFNGGLQLKYIFNHKWWSEISFLFCDNIDLGSYDNKADLVSKDNVFVNVSLRNNIKFYIHDILQTNINYVKKFASGWGIDLLAEYQNFTPIIQENNQIGIDPQKTKQKFILSTENQMTNAAFSIGIEYSHLEKFIERSFKQISLGTKYPIFSFTYTKAFPNIFNSQYNFDKLKLEYKQTIKKEPWGTVRLYGEIGKIFGKTSYMLLERPYSNLTLYYQKHMFNTVLPFEYISDNYLRWHIEHNLGLGFFRFIPYVKKWKWRQMWIMNGMIGNISSQNLQFNNEFRKNDPFKNFDGQPLIEMGTAIDNIFSIFRLSYFWRLTPIGSTRNQVLMFSFHFQF